MTGRRLAIAAALLLAGCEQHLGRTVSGLQSLEIQLVDPGPGGRGTIDDPVRLDTVTVDVAARDADNQAYSEDLDVDVYLSFAGNKIGRLTPCGNDEDSTPLVSLHLAGGVATGQVVNLTRAFGKLNLWFEEKPAPGIGSRAFGASPEVVFANPTIPFLLQPLDPGAPTAIYCNPWNGKQVNVTSATGDGRLVVTSVFPTAYVVADTGNMYDPAKDTGGFNHLFVFTFGKPPFYVQPGRVLSRVSGNLTKFVGFTELNFPGQEPSSATDVVQVPAPYELGLKDRGQNYRLYRLASATVKISGRICPIDTEADDWKKFSQFAVNLGDGVCDAFSSFAIALPGKQFGEFDPLKNIGKKFTATGMLRNFSGQNDAQPRTTCTTTDECRAVPLDSATATCIEGVCKRGAFNFWSIVPRTVDDVALTE